jgi:hypothetical protein
MTVDVREVPWHIEHGRVPKNDRLSVLTALFYIDVAE